MCRLVRWTIRRAAPWRAMRTRVFAARRILEAFLSMDGSRLLLLGFLDRYRFPRVAHALALVGLRRLVRADLGRDLADLLDVGPLDDDLRLRRRLGLHALGERMHDRVREAERQVHLVALRLRSIADAHELQALLEALLHAVDHVCDRGANRPGWRVRFLAVVGRGEGDLVAVALDRDAGRERLLEGAERALHDELGGSDRDLHLLGDDDGGLGDSGPGSRSFRPRCRALRRPLRPRGPGDRSSRRAKWTRSRRPARS